MPSTSMRKKTVLSTVANSNLSRPSLIDTMLLTSTPLRRSPGVPSITTTTSARSATNSTVQQILKDKNQMYEDIQLLNLTKSISKNDKQSMNRNVRKRSKVRRTVLAQVDKNNNNSDETENDEEIKIRKKATPHKRKTTVSKREKFEEPISKKLRRTTAMNSKRMTKAPIGEFRLILLVSW